MSRADLNDQDKLYPVFKKLIDYWNQRIDTLRQSNDKPQSELETAMIRGRIDEIKMMLKLQNDEPDFE